MLNQEITQIQTENHQQTQGMSMILSNFAPKRRVSTSSFIDNKSEGNFQYPMTSF